MLNWFTENIGTIFVLLILICIVGAAVLKMLSDKKKGKSSCGCNCGNCAMSGSCHKDNR